MDTDHRAEEVWVLGVQRKLYQQSKAHPDEVWRDLWGWLTDPRMIRHSWRRVASNKGKRSSGIDGITVKHIQQRIGEQCFLEKLRAELRSGAYRPSPSRRKLIPKAGKLGQFRPLGIPTVKDRVVQGAVKALLEPIFEAQFWSVSYGFRPGRSTHGALEHIRMSIQPRERGLDGRTHRLPYSWVIEGDIKSCFDNINHHHLMDRLRMRIADRAMGVSPHENPGPTPKRWRGSGNGCTWSGSQSRTLRILPDTLRGRFRSSGFWYAGGSHSGTAAAGEGSR